MCLESQSLIKSGAQELDLWEFLNHHIPKPDGRWAPSAFCRAVVKAWDFIGSIVMFQSLPTQQDNQLHLGGCDMIIQGQTVIQRCVISIYSKLDPLWEALLKVIDIQEEKRWPEVLPWEHTQVYHRLVTS